MKRRHLLVLATVLIGATSEGAARASDLSWSGPPGCAENDQLVFQIERALGAPLDDTGAVHLQVHIVRSGGMVRALLRVEDPTANPAVSERSLVAPDCERMLDTLTVAVALAIEAAAPVHEAPAPSPEPPAPPPVAPVAHAEVIDAPSPPEPEASDASGPVPRGEARLVTDVGSMPAPALGIGLGAQLGWPRLRLELLATLWMEQHTSVDSSEAPGAGADMQLATGALSACALPFGSDLDPVVVALCAGGELGRVSGAGTGVSAPRSANGLWMAPAVEAGLTWRPADTRLGLGAHIGAAAPLGERTFYLERLGTVHQAAAVVARAGLSIDVALE